MIIGSRRATLLLWQRLVCHCNPCVGERIVVEGSVRTQVICRGTISVDPVGPLLLQRYAKDRDPADAVSHQLQKSMYVCAFLDIVG